MKISEKLKDLHHCLISEINDLQGNLKDLSEKDYEKLKLSIEKYGFIVPFLFGLIGRESVGV
jgi:ParB-like chromosome segregation protein Spo0J